MRLRRYRFKLSWQEQHQSYGPLSFAGEVIIKAHTLDEAIFVMKQRRYEMTEVPRQSLIYNLEGDKVGFTVEPLEDDENDLDK